MGSRIQKFLGAAAFLLCPLLCFSQSRQLADSLNKRGMDFYEDGRYRQAEFYLKESFRIYQTHGNPAEWLSPGVDYAEILVDRAKYVQALELLTRLNKVATAQKETMVGVRIKNDLGWAYAKTGQNELALSYLKNAIPLAQQVKDTLRLGYIYNNIGSIYYGKGSYKAALDFRKEALSNLEKLNNPQSVSIALNNVALTYKKLTLYDKALKYYEQSLTIRKQLGNLDLLASVYNNIGSLYKRLGDFNQALVYLKKSLEYGKQAGSPEGTAATLNNIGTLYNQLGQTDLSLAYYRQSLDVKKIFAGPSSMAISYNNIASRLWDLGRYEKSSHFFMRALELRKQAGNSARIASSMLDLSQIELAKGDIKAASNYLQKARAMSDSIHDKSVELGIAIQQGDIFRAEDDLQSALKAFIKAQMLAQVMPGTDQIWALYRLAQTYDQLNSPKASSVGRKMIGLIEKMRSEVGPVSKLKMGFFKRYSDLYVNLAAWTLKYEQNSAQAYHLVESAKARSLTDELAKAAQRVDESLPEKERIERAQKRAIISDLYDSARTATKASKKQKLRDRIRDRELNYASYENQLHKNYPDYKRLKNPKPISLSKTQQMCGANTAVIEYAVTEQNLVMFFITQNEIQTKWLPLDKVSDTGTQAVTSLAKNVNRFRNAIIGKISEDSLAALSAPLYQKLITPFQEKMADYTNLMIVPDSYLAYLPFEALKKDTQADYLISKYNIKYEPSMTGFTFVSPPKNEPLPKLLAIGNSAGQPSPKGMPLLPSVGVELESIGKLFSRKKILETQEVNEKNIKKMMGKHYTYIQVAAHSIIDDKNSFLSGIILNQQQEQKELGNDGYLRSSEIYGLNIPSNLVVLSACKSAMGKLVGGEGLLGLQRAFLNAGASAVVVSLWDVYDRPTARFMLHFYRSMLKKNEPAWSDSWDDFLRAIGWRRSVPFGHTAAAMRATKLAMLHSAAYHHPVYWAPFVMMGH